MYDVCIVLCALCVLCNSAVCLYGSVSKLRNSKYHHIIDTLYLVDEMFSELLTFDCYRTYQ